MARPMIVLILGTLTFAVTTAGCIEPMDPDGRPCPCADGYVCCSGTCEAEDQGDQRKDDTPPCLQEPECEPGWTKACETGTDVGECSVGIRTCGENGLWGPCEGQVGPAQELCNGLDDDCDGETDEGFPIGEACEPLGTCTEATFACAPDGRGVQCVQHDPGQEDCEDGLDNDCDGYTDEGGIIDPGAEVDEQWVRMCPGAFLFAADGEGGGIHVRLQGFEVMRTEVTVRAYERCVRAGVCLPTQETTSSTAYRDGSGLVAINFVTWPMAQTYCRWIGARLPSETEWEYVARGGSLQLQWPWGQAQPDCTRGLVCDMTGYDESVCDEDTWCLEIGGSCGVVEEDPYGLVPTEVCSRPAGASAQGVCDLVGNVSEWVADCWSPEIDGATVSQVPREGDCTPDGRSWGDLRVIKGASFRDPDDMFPVTYRAGLGAPDSRDEMGFRCVRSPR